MVSLLLPVPGVRGRAVLSERTGSGTHVEVPVSARVTKAPSDPRRLLVITYHFDPNRAVGGLRWLGLTKYLARLGWKVAVLTATPPAGDDASLSGQVEECPRLETFLDGLRMLRRLTFGQSLGWSSHGSRVAAQSAPPGPLHRLTMEVLGFLNFPDESRGWMFRAALRARSVIRRFQPQVVVSSGPPHAAHLVARMATIGSAVPWFIDMRDPWAGPLPKAWQSYRWGTWMFRAFAPLLERLAFRAAQGIITTTSAFAEALAVKYPAVPVVCIPNGVDAECLPPPARDRYPGLGIAYAGTLYAGRDLGPLVSALRIFLERHPAAAQDGAKLRIAGEAGAGHARSFYETIAAARMEQYVEVLGRLPRAQALDVVSRSRLAVVLAQEQELQVPAKLYESVAMGIPTLVVAPADSAAGVEGGRVGAVVRDPADVEGIACLLEQLWRDDARRQTLCPVSITYEEIAPLVDQLLETSLLLACAREGVGAGL